MTEVKARRLISWDDVLARVPLSRVSIYRLVRAGDFPEPVQISKGRSCFFEDEVIAWAESRGRGVHVWRVSSGGDTG